VAAVLLLSLQGAVVALIYCFFNGEVIARVVLWTTCHSTAE